MNWNSHFSRSPCKQSHLLPSTAFLQKRPSFCNSGFGTPTCSNMPGIFRCTQQVDSTHTDSFNKITCAPCAERCAINIWYWDYLIITHRHSPGPAIVSRNWDGISGRVCHFWNIHAKTWDFVKHGLHNSPIKARQFRSYHPTTILAQLYTPPCIPSKPSIYIQKWCSKSSWPLWHWPPCSSSQDRQTPSQLTLVCIEPLRDYESLRWHRDVSSRRVQRFQPVLCRTLLCLPGFSRQ